LHLLPRLYVFVWAAVLVWSAHYASASLRLVDFVGLVLSVGLSSALGICTAHELLHRRSRFDVGLARAVTALCCYGHMVVEHLHHHATIGAPGYGATAARGASAYRFATSDFFRALFTAWRVEQTRLRRIGRPLWHNKVLQDYIGSAACAAGFAGLWGTSGLLLWLGQAAFAVFAFEVITYVHHYGLVRSEDEEPASGHAWAHHCWITNCLSFNNTFHSDHHLRPWTPYYELHAMAGAPRLPASYFTMFCVALVPPLWYRLMNPRLDAFQGARMTRAEALPELRAEHCR
jgi:alkane 1-monooxygenase